MRNEFVCVGGARGGLVCTDRVLVTMNIIIIFCFIVGPSNGGIFAVVSSI